MKNLTKLSIACISSLAITGTATANTLDFNFDLGVAFSQLSNTTSVTPVNGLTKSYTANEGRQSKPFTKIGFKYSFDHLTSKPFSLGLGLSTYYVDLGNISGTEIPGSNMGLGSELNYSMQAISAGILFELQFTYTAQDLQPYLLAGAGYAWDTLNNFAENTPEGSNAAPSNPYASHTSSNVVYEIGTGIHYPLITKQNKSLLVHLEYRYLNLGNAELGAASGQTTKERLASKNISTNIIDIGLSYQF